MWARGLPVLEELNRRGIPVIVLKSLPQIEDLYGNPGGRFSGDVDLLVPSAATVETLEAIVGLGWELRERQLFSVLSALPGGFDISRRPWHFYAARNNQPSTMDLHSDRLVDPPKPPLDPAIWGRAVPVTRDGVSFLVLAQEDRLNFLCWHFFADSATQDGFAWPKLKDIELALGRHAELDWEYLATRARECGTLIALRLACDLAEARAEHALPAVWRDRLPLPHPRRFEILRSVVIRRGDSLSGRQRTLLWLLAHDNPAAMWRVWRHIVLPSRARVAADYLGAWPSWPEYLAQLVRIYRQRLRRFH